MDAYGHIAFSVDRIYLSVSVPLLFNNFILKGTDSFIATSKL